MPQAYNLAVDNGSKIMIKTVLKSRFFISALLHLTYHGNNSTMCERRQLPGNPGRPQEDVRRRTPSLTPLQILT